MSDPKTAKNEAKRRFRSKPGVEGFGVGDGCVRIYVRDESVGKDLPRTIAGVTVHVVPVGTVEAGEGDQAATSRRG